jgi:hypothetical protein
MEIWKDVVWYEWYYEVSNMGNVKSINHYNRKTDIILKKQIWTGWYMFVCLWKPYRKQYMIHRLVAKHFIQNIEDKPEVNHKDWNKLNNNVENLERVTSHDNAIHKYRILNNKWPRTWILWDNHGRAKSVLQYDHNMKFIKERGSVISIEKEMLLCRKHVASVCRWEWKTAWGFIWKYKHG